MPRNASEPRESLSSDRLALVERYMIDAEEAEARGRAAAKDAEARAQRAAEEQLRREAERAREEAVAQAQRAAEEQLRRETLRARRSAEPARREPEEVLTSEAIAEVEPDEHPAQPAERLTASANGEARRRKVLAKAERRAAKEAAHLAVAVEKREARERKALAKAAAKRRSRELKARAKIVR